VGQSSLSQAQPRAPVRLRPPISSLWSELVTDILYVVPWAPQPSTPNINSPAEFHPKYQFTCGSSPQMQLKKINHTQNQACVCAGCGGASSSHNHAPGTPTSPQISIHLVNITPNSTGKNKIIKKPPAKPTKRVWRAGCGGARLSHERQYAFHVLQSLSLWSDRNRHVSPLGTAEEDLLRQARATSSWTLGKDLNSSASAAVTVRCSRYCTGASSAW
jgi:hypothetical protein